MKFIHDVVHQTFVLLLVPDHPLLKTTTWNFIGTFFGPQFASYAALVLLLVIPSVFMYHSVTDPLPFIDTANRPEKRKKTAIVVSGRYRKSVPVIIYMLVIVSAWFFTTDRTQSRIFNPDPDPVVAEDGKIIIPVRSITTDLLDGRLHKYSFQHKGEEMRLLILKKKEGVLSVSLDACELCPPEGYGQRNDRLICLYCGTPIAVNSLGQPGGCNPIPLIADIDSKSVKIGVDEIVRKWGYVNSAGRTGQ